MRRGLARLFLFMVLMYGRRKHAALCPASSVPPGSTASTTGSTGTPGRTPGWRVMSLQCEAESAPGQV